MDHDAKEFAEHLILQILPTLPSDDLCEIDALLTYVDKAVKGIAGKPDSFDKAKLTQFKMINDFIDSVDEKDGLREFAAYMAPRLLDNSTDSREMKRVTEFL